MKKRVIIITAIIFAAMLFSYCIYSKINRFRFYKSDEGIETMIYAFSQLEPYAYTYSDIPDAKMFFEYLKDLSKSNEFFPENFEASLGKLKSKDFVFTTEYTYIYVWLFSESEFDLEKDSITFAHTTLKDFLLEKNFLVALYSYPSPCRKEHVYIEKDRKSVKNPELFNKLNEVLGDIWHFQIQQGERKNDRSLSLCCFHIYFNNSELTIENYHNYVQDECRLDEELKNEILKRLNFLKDQYSSYDFYIQFYIDTNRKLEETLVNP